MSTRMLLSDCVIIDTQRWFKSPINPPEILFILTKVFLCLRGPIPQRQQKHCGCESNSVSSLLLADLHALSLKIWQRSQTHFTPKFSPTATRFTEDTKRENLQELYLFCHWSTWDVLYSLAPHPPKKNQHVTIHMQVCVCLLRNWLCALFGRYKRTAEHPVEDTGSLRTNPQFISSLWFYLIVQHFSS